MAKPKKGYANVCPTSCYIWMHSYLVGREQMVEVNGTLSPCLVRNLAQLRTSQLK